MLVFGVAHQKCIFKSYNSSAEGLKLLQKEKDTKGVTVGQLQRRRHLPPKPLTVAEAKDVLERLRIENEAKEVSSVMPLPLIEKSRTKAIVFT